MQDARGVKRLTQPPRAGGGQIRQTTASTTRGTPIRPGQKTANRSRPPLRPTSGPWTPTRMRSRLPPTSTEVPYTRSAGIFAFGTRRLDSARSSSQRWQERDGPTAPICRQRDLSDESISPCRPHARCRGPDGWAAPRTRPCAGHIQYIQRACQDVETLVQWSSQDI